MNDVAIILIVWVTGSMLSAIIIGMLDEATGKPFKHEEATYAIIFGPITICIVIFASLITLGRAITRKLKENKSNDK